MTSKKFFYLIITFILLTLCGCSNLPGYANKQYDEKTETISLVFQSSNKSIYLLGNYLDYVFYDERLFLYLDIITTKGFYSKDRNVILINNVDSAKLEIPSAFEIHKSSSLLEKQKTDVENIRKKLENFKIKYTIDENDEKWTFNLKKSIKLTGSIIKLETHNKLIEESKDKLVNIKIDIKYKLRNPIAQGVENALSFFLAPVLIPTAIVIWTWVKLSN